MALFFWPYFWEGPFLHLQMFGPEFLGSTRSFGKRWTFMANAVFIGGCEVSDRYMGECWFETSVPEVSVERA
jgi:hypothetical protein